MPPWALYLGVAAAALVGGYYITTAANNNTAPATAPADYSGLLGGSYGIAPLSGGFMGTLSPDATSTSGVEADSSNAAAIQSALAAQNEFLSQYVNAFRGEAATAGLFNMLGNIFAGGNVREINGSFNIFGQPLSFDLAATPINNSNNVASFVIPNAISPAQDAYNNQLVANAQTALATPVTPSFDFFNPPAPPAPAPIITVPDLPTANVQTTIASTVNQSVAASNATVAAAVATAQMPTPAPLAQTPTPAPAPVPAPVAAMSGSYTAADLGASLQGPPSTYAQSIVANGGSLVSYGTPTDTPNPPSTPAGYQAALLPESVNGVSLPAEPIYYQTATPDPGVIPAPIAAQQVINNNPLYVGPSTVGFTSTGDFQFANGTTIPGPVASSTPSNWYYGIDESTYGSDPESQRQLIQDINDAKTSWPKGVAPNTPPSQMP